MRKLDESAMEHTASQRNDQLLNKFLMISTQVTGWFREYDIPYVCDDYILKERKLKAKINQKKKILHTKYTNV